MIVIGAPARRRERVSARSAQRYRGHGRSRAGSGRPAGSASAGGSTCQSGETVTPNRPASAPGAADPGAESTAVRAAPAAVARAPVGSHRPTADGARWRRSAEEADDVDHEV